MNKWSLPRRFALRLPLSAMVAQSVVELGQTAARAILDMINEKSVELPILTADLIIRETVARRI